MNIEEYGIYILYTLIYIACAVGLKYAMDFKASSHYSADDELAGGNIAVGLRRTGAQFGLAIAMMGVLSGSSAESLSDDMLMTAFYGIVSVCFIISTLLVTDRFVTPGLNNQQLLKENNISIGTVELGMLIATGIMAYSSIVGDGGVLSSVIYFAIGQASLVMLVLFYEKCILRKFNIVHAIGEGNLSAGVYLGGKLVAYSLILKSAISGNAVNTDPSGMALEYLTAAIAGMVLLYLFEYIIDLVIITSSNVTSILNDDRAAPALQLSAAKIGVALILSNAIL